MSKREREVWPREIWTDAMWDDPAPNPAMRAIANAYARFAGPSSFSWVSWPELKRRTGIKSNDAISGGLRRLEDEDWLKLARRGGQHESNLYQLIVPEHSGFRMPEPVDNLVSHPESGVVSNAQHSGFRTSALRIPEGSALRNPESTVLNHSSKKSSKSRARRAARSEDLGQVVDTIIEEMLDHAEITITPDHALSIYRDVLDRASTTPQHPLSYVLKAIRDQPHRYRPVPIPPPAPSARQLPLVASVDDTRPAVDRRGLARGGWRASGTDG